eukprot:GFUD01037836.1.p1 GENE.GFUD01037836.1~~GFUD01037836.1.p1  ORF type:complete len:335 (+),score=78.64 GFUD01037836.1:152-1156(+)
MISKATKRWFVPLILCVVCLAMYSVIYPECSLVVVLSEAMFYIISGYFVSHAILHGKKKPKTQLISFLLLPTFAILLLTGPNTKIHLNMKVKKEKLLTIVVNTVSVSLVMLLLQWLKVLVNEIEIRRMLMNSNNHLGPGLARTFFGFLKIVTDGELGTPGLETILQRYADNEGIQLHHKVFILFPKNTSQDVGSHSWMFEMEREYNMPDHLRNHGPIEFTFQGCTQQPYFLNGKERVIELAVIKMRNTETGLVYYAAIAENRPLITLQKMVNIHSLKKPFSEEDFKLHSEIYKKGLTSMIEEDAACQERFEIVDMQRDNGNFTMKIYNRVGAEG